MRGRKPKSEELKAAQGNPGKRPIRKSDPKSVVVGGGGIKQPKWARRTAPATRIWNQITPLLDELNLSGQLDAFALHRYCRYCVDWVTVDEALQAEGMVVDVPTGNTTKRAVNPAFKVRKELEVELEKIEKSYGMRPVDRYKVLREQSAILGGLPGGRGAEKKDDEAPSRSSLVGSLKDFDSPPPERLQ